MIQNRYFAFIISEWCGHKTNIVLYWYYNKVHRICTEAEFSEFKSYYWCYICIKQVIKCHVKNIGLIKLLFYRPWTCLCVLDLWNSYVHGIWWRSNNSAPDIQHAHWQRSFVSITFLWFKLHCSSNKSLEWFVETMLSYGDSDGRLVVYKLSNAEWNDFDTTALMCLREQRS